MEILNIKDIEFISEDSVYIGRGNKTYNLKCSPLANPFNIGKKFTRETSLFNYKHWLINSYASKKGPAYKELMRLLKLYKSNPNLNLVCWCSPQACHGEVIKQVLNWCLKNNKDD
jgi:hypothetical protein